MHNKFNGAVITIIIVTLFLTACKGIVPESAKETATTTMMTEYATKNSTTVETTTLDSNNRPSPEQTSSSDAIPEDFTPMSEEEMENAAKSKELIRYELIKNTSLNFAPKEEIDFETEIAGITYTGKLIKVRTEFNYQRDTVTATYHGILSPQD
ncbi:MAG: hypothetical protein Q4E09_03255 [Eubacteriales bacterium]|nr:hypothetical protein [Eubacteriales bacterium]